MSERLLGFILLFFLVPMALAGYLVLCFHGLFGKVSQGRPGVRALDHFVNATLFGGSAWESISSHAWRVRKEKYWARLVIWFTDKLDKGHCERANKRERHMREVVNKHQLEKETIW